MQWIQIGNAQGISHQRAGTGTAPRPYGHTVSLGPIDKVLNDQEVPGELHGRNCLEFVLQSFDILGAARIALGLIRIQEFKSTLQAFVGKLRHILIKRNTFGRREKRQLRLLKYPVQIAALSNDDRVVNRLRNVGKESPHLLFCLQILLFGIGLGSPGIRKNIAARDATAYFVSVEVLTM